MQRLRKRDQPNRPKVSALRGLSMDRRPDRMRHIDFDFRDIGDLGNSSKHIKSFEKVWIFRIPIENERGRYEKRCLFFI